MCDHSSSSLPSPSVSKSVNFNREVQRILSMIDFGLEEESTRSTTLFIMNSRDDQGLGEVMLDKVGSVTV